MGRRSRRPSPGCSGAAAILGERAGLSGAAVKASYRGLLGAMARHAGRAGDLAGALTHFVKVTRSYWPGLFHCYDVADLPRTNNDLEQFFGWHRYHERRCERPEGGVAGAGGAGVGAAAGGGGDAAARRGPGRGPGAVMTNLAGDRGATACCPGQHAAGAGFLSKSGR